jgi:hypothetical protein
VKPEENSPGSQWTEGWMDSGDVLNFLKKEMTAFHLQGFEARIEQPLA